MRILREFYLVTRDNILLFPALLFMGCVFVVPLLGILATALHLPELSLAAFRDVLTSSLYRKVIFNTFEISFLSTVLAAIVGYPIAYLINGSGSRTKTALYLLVMLSFWVSMIVRSFAWITILSREGVVAFLFESIGISGATDGLLYAKFSVVVGMANVLLPFMIFPILGSMDSIDENLPKAAETLGARGHQVFTRVFFPLSLPGLAAGCLLVFVLSLGFYITPTLLGGPDSVMVSQLISREVNETLNWPIAAAVSTLLLVTTFGGVAVFNKVVGIDRLFR